MLNIKKFLYLIIIGFITAATAQAWTTSKVKAVQDPAGEWRLHSMPEHILNSRSFIEMSANGMLSYITVVRDKGLWENPLIAGNMAGKEHFVEKAYVRIENLKHFLDLSVSENELIVMTYLVDYGEIVVYFHIDRWKDEHFHKRVAAELNKSMKKTG